MPDIDERRFLGEDPHRLTAAGGATIQGQARIRVVPGERMMVVKLALDQGFLHPLHNHPDNESMGVVLEGALEMTIGEETSVLRAGDVWHHPPGVFHSTRALEPTLVAEFHHPLRDDLMQLLSDGSDR